MKALFYNRIVQFGLRAVIGAAFIYAGAIKMMSPQEFADNIAAYHLLPPVLINLMALGLPEFEIAVGLMLITGLRLSLAAFSIMVLSVVFGLAIASAIARGLVIDCGCFGGGPPSVFKLWLSLGRDVALGLAAWMIWHVNPAASSTTP